MKSDISFLICISIFEHLLYEITACFLLTSRLSAVLNCISLRKFNCTLLAPCVAATRTFVHPGIKTNRYSIGHGHKRSLMDLRLDNICHHLQVMECHAITIIETQNISSWSLVTDKSTPKEPVISPMMLSRHRNVVGLCNNEIIHSMGFGWAWNVDANLYWNLMCPE